MSPLATNDGDDVTRTELCLRGLGGGIGRSLFSSPLSAESESFFSNRSFVFDPEEAAKSSSTSFPSDLDLRCMGRGGAIGLRSEDVLLGGGGIGGARRLTTSVTGRVLLSEGGALEEGSSNFGLAGNGGKGPSTPKRLSRSRLTEEQRTGGMGARSQGSLPASSPLQKKNSKGVKSLPNPGQRCVSVDSESHSLHRNVITERK